MNFNSLYKGRVFHRRFNPKTHTLSYQVFSTFVDLDDLESLADKTILFSYNRWNVFSLHDKDFGSGVALRDQVTEHLRHADIDEKPVRVCLLCYPRLFGYAFNPLSVFYCYNSVNEITAVIYEVHNTFGEQHVYALRTERKHRERKNEYSSQTGSACSIQQECKKAMYVSPFNPPEMRYKFTLNEPAKQIKIGIQVYAERELTMTAAFAGKQCNFDDKNLALLLIRHPFMTLKVVFGIHWEAFRLWMKRVPWFSFEPKSTRTSQ